MKWDLFPNHLGIFGSVIGSHCTLLRRDLGDLWHSGKWEG